MKVTAVIPHWNRAALLRTLLDNLRGQTRSFDEVVVVDNGSTDGSADLAEKAGARVIRLDRNYGFAAAVNRGIAASDADWIAILNNDVTLDPPWLERLLGSEKKRYIRMLDGTSPTKSGATSGLRIGSESGRERASGDRQSQQALQSQARAGRPEVVHFATGKILSARDHATLDGAWDEVSRAACPVRIGAGALDMPDWNTSRPIRMASMTACLIRRQVFTDLGPLDERFESYLEDVDFGLRCAKAGFAGVYEPAAVAYHQGSSTWGRWNPDTVRLLSRNQVLLTAKHFRGQPRWPILAGQLLWGLVALRHGCGLAWLRGKLAGWRMAGSIDNDTQDSPAFSALVQESETDILAHQHELYWRLYSWLAPR